LSAITACHPDMKVDGSATAAARVQWGAVSTAMEDVGHCTFTNGEVFQPEDGRLYAGVLRRLC
jgi:hypothetical protein